MHRSGFIFAAVLTWGLAGGQNVPSRFVVTGEAAKKIGDFNSINLATAQKIAETCEGLVKPRGGAHTIMILDRDGNPVYSDRMDGQGYTNVITAEWKARTAYLTHQPSKAVMNRVAKDPNDEAYEVQQGLYPAAGGLPIVINNQIIGFAGAGGYRPDPPKWSDEICIHTSMDQIFGAAPPLLEDIREPREANPHSPNLPVPTFGTKTAPKSSLSPDYVITGADAAHVFEGTQISLASAKKDWPRLRNWASSKGAAMSLTVIDDAGELVHMERMDGDLGTDTHAALAGARTALKLREPTSLRGNATEEIQSRRTAPVERRPLRFHAGFRRHSHRRR